MISRPTLKWLALAGLGLLIAVAIAIAGSRLASRQIGLSSEPIRAGDALAPRVSRTPTEKPTPVVPAKPSPAPAPATTPSPAPASPVEPSPQSGTNENSGDHDADD